MEYPLLFLFTVLILHSAFFIHHSAAGVIQLPQTGQTKCYDTAGAEIGCAGLCGYTNWRLPNRKELKSLVNRQLLDSAIWLNSQGVGNVQAYWYWSSSTSAGYTSRAWGVNMSVGSVGNDSKDLSLYVWSVRSGQ